MIPTARVERAHSHRARSASKGSSQLPHPLFFFSILLVLVHNGFQIRPTDHLSLEEDFCAFYERRFLFG